MEFPPTGDSCTKGALFRLISASSTEAPETDKQMESTAKEVVSKAAADSRVHPGLGVPRGTGLLLTICLVLCLSGISKSLIHNSAAHAAESKWHFGASLVSPWR